MRNLNFGCAFGAIAVAIVAAAPVQAQETTSTIRGTVTANGAPVNGAAVTVTHVPSGTRSVVTTDNNGLFNASGIRAGGPFTVVVAAPGQPSSSVTDIFTVAAQTFDLPIDLASGSEEIVVTASSLPNARSVSQGPATVLSSADIANIATVNRDIRDLSRRDPFARLDDTPTGGRAISFAGQNARYNRFSVDGVPITDNFGLNTDGLPSRRSPIPLDAIGQFQAKVAPFDVREGNFQGGAINIVLKSGTNEFHGTGFYARSGDEFVGEKTKNIKVAVPNFKVENYGAELSGPIIKDKLFFMVAGERLRGGRPIPEGPVDNNVGLVVPNLTQAQVDQISSIAKSVYNYDTGGVLHNLGDKDDRLVAKIDANLSDTQRLSLTYTYAKDGINLLNNTFVTTTGGNPGLGLASNAYIQGNQLHTGVVQLNSDWSDSFSTEVRGFYKKYKRIQDPVLGRGFAQFRVCTQPTSDRGTAAAADAGGTNLSTGCPSLAAIVAFGPDNSRQTNQLNTESWGGLVQARLSAGDHDFRLFGEYADVKIFNAFLQNSAGNYYFDSIADFQNRTASSITYGNAIPSLDPNDAAAAYGYQSYTVGIMDSWKVTPELNIAYGARYDLFGGSDRPALNNGFTTRYGFANNSILSGRGLLQPRFGFDYKPLPRLSFRGGGGIFGGGAPDVYLSNSFSNTGVLTNSISITRTNNGNNFSGATTNTAIGTAALSGVTGTSIPNAVNTFLGGTTAAATSPTNELAPGFKIPSQWRATLSAEYRADLGPLGDNWIFGADFLYSKVRNQVLFTDIRSVPIAGSLTPDGRQRYQNAIDGAASTNTNSDILLTNTKKGRAYIAVARLEKSWSSGLSFSASYTHQNVKDQAPATSSTAGSNYSNGAFVDPNIVSYGTSNDQVEHFFKYSLAYEHAFFGDYKTSIALFGETRSGHPFSYTFQDFGGTRSSVFGTTGVSSATSTAGNRYLLYVPTGPSDPLVSYNSTATRDAFETFINASGLSKYRGKVAPRNAFKSKWFTRFDLHLSQEVPTGLGDSRVTLFADVENFTNFINKNWGQQREYVFPYNAAVISVKCVAAAGAAAQGCATYRYSPVNNAATFTAPVDQVYTNQSLYSIRVGARFSF